MTRQTRIVLIACAVFIVLMGVIALMPVSFVSRSPGIAYDLLGKDENTRPIDIEGESTYQPTGSLLLPTMSVTKIESSITLIEAIATYMRQDRNVVPRTAVYPVSESKAESDEEKLSARQVSQQAATVAGLRAAGEPISQVPQVRNVVVSGPAYLRLQAGDYIEAVDATPVTNTLEFNAAVHKHAIGDLVQLDVKRNGIKLKVGVTTVAANDDQRLPRLGIELTNGYSYTSKVSFNLEDGAEISGAGLALALGIYDLLTEEDLLKGRKVAATGEIAADGTVKAFTGVRERLTSAEQAGATIFLMPAANCSDILAQKYSLTIVKVTNLFDAISSLRLLTSDPNASQVPRC